MGVPFFFLVYGCPILLLSLWVSHSSPILISLWVSPFFIPIFHPHFSSPFFIPILHTHSSFGPVGIGELSGPVDVVQNAREEYR